MDFPKRTTRTSCLCTTVIAVTMLAVLELGLLWPGPAGAANKGINSRRIAPGARAQGKLQGLCYSPYLNCEPSEGDGINPARLASLMNKVAPYTNGLRTFCATGIWVDIVTMAKAKGLYLAAGCDIYTDPDYNEVELNGLIELARAGKVDLAVVGDETLAEEAISEGKLIEYIRRVKATGVPTTTSDSYDQLLAHPRVMAECDVIIANIYPFWEGVSIRKAINYLDSCYQQVKRAAGGKEVIVETGWPSAGKAVGSANPGLNNAATYLSGFMSWAKSRGVRYFYFEAFDEPWRAGREGEVGAHWGLWDQNGRLKTGLGKVIGTR